MSLSWQIGVQSLQKRFATCESLSLFLSMRACVSCLLEKKLRTKAYLNALTWYLRSTSSITSLGDFKTEKSNYGI